MGTIVESNFMNTKELEDKGMSLMNQGKYREALACFDSIIAVTDSDDPTLFRVYNGKGCCLSALGRNDEALKSFDLGIANYSNYPMLWVNKGKVLQKMGRNAEAQEYFKKVKGTPYESFLK